MRSTVTRRSASRIEATAANCHIRGRRRAFAFRAT
jgi:hypothetical protein